MDAGSQRVRNSEGDLAYGLAGRGPVVVRAATFDDLSVLMALYLQLHDDDRPIGAETAAEIWDSIGATLGRTVLLAEVAGVAVGTIDVTIVSNLTRGGKPFALVENVVVDEAWRRQGVGRSLVKAALLIAQRSDCYKLQLSASELSACAFYESIGMAVAARTYNVRLPLPQSEEP